MARFTPNPGQYYYDRRYDGVYVVYRQIDAHSSSTEAKFVHSSEAKDYVYKHNGWNNNNQSNNNNNETGQDNN